MKMKKVAALALTGMLAVSCAAPAMASAAPTDSLSQYTMTASASAALKKVGNKWYCYKGSKKLTGLQKVGKKYYYFAKNGVMQSGKQTINGFTYYFKTASNKTAPAVVNATQKIGSVTYYFSSTGRGFISCGNASGNKAVAKVMDGVKFTSSMTSMDKLKTAYEYIMATYAYVPADVPDLNNKNWIYGSAYNMVFEGDAKCYNYASLTGLTARALGFKAAIITGTSKKTAAAVTATEHAWVLIDGKYVLDTCFDDNDKTEGDQYFYLTYDEILNTIGTEYFADKTF